MKFPFRKSISRPPIAPRAEGRRALRNITPRSTGGDNPPGPSPVTGNLFSATLDGQDYYWLGTNRAQFYRYLRDHVPIISAAVWSWVHLCCTPQTCTLDGGETEKKRPARFSMISTAASLKIRSCGGPESIN